MILKVEVGNEYDLPGGQRLYIGGRMEDGRVLMSRDWWRGDKGVDDLCADNNRFHPFVRRVIAQNRLLHLGTAERGIKDLAGSCEGATVVLIGAGPSAKRNIGELHAETYPGDVVVVALNAAMKLCHEPPTRVRPDYFFVLCWAARDDWWEGTDTEIPCVLNFQAPSSYIGAFKDRIYWASSFGLLDGTSPPELERYGGLDVGLTVTYSAIHFAQKLGAAKVILLGQDMAYTNSENHFGEPIAFDLAKKRRAFMARGVRGEAVLTDRRMVEHRDIVLGAAHWLEKHGVPLYNCTGAGILDLGKDRNVTLRKALEESCPSTLPRLPNSATVVAVAG